MITEILIPSLGVNDTKALIIEWTVDEDTYAQAGQEICVIETSKMTQSLTAVRSGYVRRKASAGDEVGVQSVIGWIADELGEASHEMAGREKPEGAVEVTRKARELASRLGVRLEDLGKQRGIIREKDVREYALRAGGDVPGANGYGPTSDLPGGIALELVKETEPLSRAQRMIKDTVLKSLGANAHSYVALDVCVDRAVAAISELTNRLAQAVRLNDALIYATARALTDCPVLNGFYWNDQRVTYNSVNIGLAMDFEGVLTVPVIRDANKKSLAEIARESGLLQMKLFRKTLSPADCEGGTFTITNLGILGIHTFVPIINGYQAAILAAGAVVQSAVTRGGSWVGVESITLGLSYDHRLNNGMGAARFLNAVKSYLEELATEG